MSKLALQADVCYNKPINIVVPGDVCSISRLVNNLSWRLSTMRTLSLHVQVGNSSLKCCPSCPEDSQWHPATPEFFHRDKRSKDGLHSPCKACRLLYRQSHIEQQRIYDAKWHSDNKEHCSEVSKQYRQTERGIIAKRARAHNRRARKRNAIGTHTVEELSQQLQRQKGKCYYCHKKLGKGRDSWNGDHIMPLSKGGTNYIDNIVIVCPSCNFKKGTKLPHEWPEGGRLL